MKTLLRNAGYKATPKRLALLDLLNKSKEPLSIQEMTKRLRGKKMDQVTTYRILDVFEKIGLVRRVDLRHGHADYELANDDHHHIICTNCGKIEDFDDCNLDALTKKIAKKSKSFSIIRRHSLEFFGVCKSCATK